MGWQKTLAWWIEFLIPIIALIFVAFDLQRFIGLVLGWFILLYVAKSTITPYYQLKIFYDLLMKKHAPKTTDYYEVKGFRK